MNKLNGDLKTPADQISQLEAENKIIRAENQRLQSDHAATLFKLAEQIAIEKSYEESQSRFQAIFYQSKLGNKIIAPDLRVIQINDALQQMLGYNEKEIVGTKIIEYAHPDFIHHWHELQENLWTKQIPSFQIETLLIKKDGSYIWCQVTSILFRDQGTTLGYTIVEDINERKVLEANLQKLYDNQETIMHMIAHDLKSPLHNIKVVAGFLRDNLAERPAKELEEQAETGTFINMIADTSDKALILIDDLLLIGEVESSQAVLEETNLQDFIHLHLHKLRAGAQPKGITVTFHCPEEPVYAPINQDKFKRVLENLLSNAIKFTHEKGQVTITLKSKGEKTRLQVQDNGIGIPEKLQAIIFHKFTKASRTGTEGEPTTGLGLYIVKQIIDMHQGQVWVESQEQVGTTFFIELPTVGR